MRLYHYTLFIIHFTLAACALSARTAQADVVIYGATSAGISAAVQATRMGKSAIIVEPAQDCQTPLPAPSKSFQNIVIPEKCE